MVENYDSEAPQIIKDFMRFIKVNMNHSNKTADEYYLDLRIFFRFMKQERGIAPPDMPFDEIPINDIDLEFVSGIKRTDLNNYIDYLRNERVVHEGTAKESKGLSAASTQRKIACLKSFYNYLCEKTEKLTINPTMGLIVPRIKKHLPSYFTQEESFKLLSSVEGRHEKRDFCILIIALSCGLRVSEIVGIDVQDIRTSAGNQFLNIVGKGGKERQVFLNKVCIDAINDYLSIRETEYKPETGHEDALFLSQQHKRISVDAVQNLVKKAEKDAGLRKYSPHKLRHTAATLMMQNGVDVRTLQELLGHSKLATTEIYCHVNEDALRTASRANPISRFSKEDT